MFEFISNFLDAHYWTVSYALTYALGTIASLAIISRFIRMFPTYIKTGELGNNQRATVFYNDDYKGIHGLDFVKIKVRDFFTETHLESIIVDTFVVGFGILIIHIAWLLFVGGGIVFATVYGIIKLMHYLREQHIKKQEFYSVLRGK